MDIIDRITDKDDNIAFAATKEIAAASELTPEYYNFLDDFAKLLNHKKSYIRTRAFILCCSQAKWDTNDKIKMILPQMLQLFHDEKPTVVRQCLNAVKEIIVYKPEFSKDIKKEMENINLDLYKDTVRPLIKKDILQINEIIEETENKNER